jgi:hypothetical protein
MLENGLMPSVNAVEITNGNHTTLVSVRNVMAASNNSHC